MSRYFFFPVLAISVPLFAQTDPDERELRPGVPVKGHIAWDQCAEYFIDLPAASSVEIELEQGGYDFTFLVTPPDGEK